MKAEFTQRELALTYRANSGRIIAALVASCSDLQLAEDALHDACLQAGKAWMDNGLPNDPAAWLYVASKRRLIDVLRAKSRKERKSAGDTLFEMEMQVSVSDEEELDIPDERLSLIFTCCHPALSRNAQVALTLKTLCGLTVREIARAFLVSDTTMGQRLVRAKHKLRVNAIRYLVPKKEELGVRLEAVLSVIYLIYNESYSCYEGQSLTRDDLANEAIRLASIVCRLLPSGESKGLLALITLHQSRRAARCDDAMGFIALEDQDRTQWDHQLIVKGRKLLLEAFAEDQLGKYQLQAAISAVHSEAQTWAETDWAQIIGLYRQLLLFDPSPVIRLNMLTAVAFSGGLALAKQGILALKNDLDNYLPFHVALADIEYRLGNKASSISYYEHSIAMCRNSVEQAHLKRKMQRVYVTPAVSR